MPIHIPPVSGGTVNTGNAVAADVADGKIFSSSELTNVAGTSTKNATVPVDAPMMPPQAFVDNAIHLYQGESLSGKGLTHLDFNAFFSSTGIAATVNVSDWTADASNNAIPTVDVDEIIEYFAATESGPPGGHTATLDLSGGTNGVPTPSHVGPVPDFVENADITTMVGFGWIVRVNEYVDRVSGATEVVTYEPTP